MFQNYKLHYQNIALSIFHGFIMWKIKLFQSDENNVKRQIKSMQPLDTVFWNTFSNVFQNST